MKNEFTPKLFSLIREGISGKTISRDVVSGIIVGIVALPLAIAFAIASGVSPERGLTTAIVAGFIISLLGGSRVQIGGPTGAFIVIIFGIVGEHGIEGLVISTIMGGVIVMGFGLARFGNYLKFIPYPLIVGFTSGIALIIFSSQVNDMLGLNISDMPSGFIEKWIAYIEGAEKVNLYALVIAVSTILLTKYFYKIFPKIPGSVIAIVLSTLVVYIFQLPVDTIESKFGAIPNTFTIPHFPDIDFQLIKSLIQPAFAIAILASLESLLSAVVADGMIGSRHRPNMELVAQGAANIFSGLLGGLPATGAIARTATNIRNGGRTPIAGIVHSITLLMIMLLLAPYAKLIPLSCLAGILIVVAYNMSEWRQFRSIIKSRSMDILILLTTFFLTVLFDLIIAIEIGIVLSSFLFMKRMSDSQVIRHVKVEDTGEENQLFQNELVYDSEKILLYEINGPLFFGAAQQFRDVLSSINTKPEFIIIRMRYVPFIDGTGFHRLKEMIRTMYTGNTKVLISGVSSQLRKEFEKNEMFTVIEKGFVFETINEALEFAKS
jgi:SulP family sulfate permease